MKKIKLTQGKCALVDDEDFEMLSRWKWCAALDKKTRSFRAMSNRHRWENIKPITMRMERIVIGAIEKQLVDHINHDTLDNRKINLHIVNHHQNGGNRKPKRNSKSGYKGVSWNKGIKKWQAQIRINYKLQNLHFSENPKECAEAYNKAAVKYFGEFAYLNIV